MNKKIIAFGLACVFAASMAAPAGAVTDAQYQVLVDQLANLTALYNNLLAQTSGGTTPATGLCLTSNLSQGMTSAEAKILQQGLNKDSATQVAVSGAGAPGYETSYFGPLTKAAVIKFQEKYASEVLASWGLTKGTGYAGSTTRAKFNALYCTAAPVVPPVTYPEGCTSAVGFSTTTGLPCSTTVTYPEGCTSAVGFSPTTGLSCAGTTTTTVGPAEGTLTVSDSAIFQETILHKADIGKVVLAFDAKAQDSALTVQRVDVNFSGTSILPWQTFKTLYLYQGSTLLKEITAVKEDYVENTYGSNYTLRFTGLNASIAQDATEAFSLKTDVFASPSNTASYTLKVLTNGVRAVDTAGINQYHPALDTTVVNTIGAIGATTAALDLSTAADNPIEGVILGNASSVVSNQEILKFNLKATTGNVTVRTIAATTTSGGDTNESNVISAAKLYDGNTLLKSKAVVDGGFVTFDKLNMLVSEGTTKSLTIKVDVKPITTEGYTINAAVAKTGITSSDSQDALVSAGGSDVAGKNLHIYTVAPSFSFIGGKITPDANSPSYATTEIIFSVTANGGDIYIPDTAVATGTGPVIIADLYGVAGATGTIGSIVTTGATAGTTNTYLVHSGGTETFTISTSIATTTKSGLMGINITEVFWATTDIAITNVTSTAYGLELFKSGLINLY